jgi:hypothetical protein
MIGDSVSVTINAVAYTLTKRTEQGYSSVYSTRDATHEVTLRVRHTNEAGRQGSPATEAHRVDLTRRIYATATDPARSYTASVILRLEKDSDPDKVEQLMSAMCGFLSAAMIDKVANWES